VILIAGLNSPSFEEEEPFEGDLQFPLELPLGVLDPATRGLVRVAR